MADRGLLRLVGATADGAAHRLTAAGTAGERRWTSAWPRRSTLPAALVVAAAVGALSTFRPLLALAACLALVLAACVWARPALAAYLLVALTPLTAGIGRGLAIPVLRPNEALAVFLGGVLIARSAFDLRSGRLAAPHLSRVESSMLLMALTSSVVPLLWMLARQRQISHDDLLYAVVLWKYLSLYVIVRLSVRSDRQVRVCLWLSMAAACIVALVAILESRGLFGVPGLLASYFAPFGNTGALENARGSSTLALAAATGDLMVFNLAIATGLWLRERRHGLVLACVAALFVLGTVASGETSSAIGLAIGVLCIVIVTSSPRLLLVFVPAGAVASLALWPVIARRLVGFQTAYGIPVSWLGRLHNLHTYFWPVLFSHWNFVLGVRPSARVAVASQATGYVWIESGYTWLLWGGGIPLLASFVFFVYASLKMTWRVGRLGHGASSVAGIAAFAAVVVVTVLMVFDPHLTYRGSADALFFLLALAAPRAEGSDGHAPGSANKDPGPPPGTTRRKGDAP
jgi:hypothetical protein